MYSKVKFSMRPVKQDLELNSGLLVLQIRADFLGSGTAMVSKGI